jgi:hypothetical protein
MTSTFLRETLLHEDIYYKAFNFDSLGYNDYKMFIKDEQKNYNTVTDFK